MSANVRPSTVRISPPQQTTPSAAVGQQLPPEAAPVQESPQAHVVDGFQPESTHQQEWATRSSANSTSVLRQTNENNCGPAAVLMASSKGSTKGAAAAHRMAELEAKFTDGDGTTPKQLGQMLAHEGVAVKQAAFKYDQHTVDQTLKNGGKLLAMVDSNQIQPGGNKDAAGGAHWVVIDGKDANGNYTVKDPATGSSYGVDFNHLSNAVDNGWWKHQGGGMLLVEDAPAGTSVAALAEANANMTVPIADKEGIGSKAGSTFGRESY